LGDENFKKEKFDDAIKCYKEAIEINPNFSAAWNNLGYTYIKLGRLDEAKKCKDVLKTINERPSDIINDNKIKSSYNTQQSNEIPGTENTSTISQDTPYSPNILLICLFFIGIGSLFLGVIGFIITIIIVIASTYFVYKDEKAINSTSDWWIGVLLLWIIMLPAYILLRKSIFEKNKMSILKDDSSESNYNSNDQQKGKKKSFIRKIPGFRSGTPWKMVLAIIVYIFIFIMIIIMFILGAFIFGLSGSINDYQPPVSTVKSPLEKSTTATIISTTAPSVTEKQDKATLGEKNAAKKAFDYLRVMPFSRDGLIKQLEFEGFSHQEAVYGVDQSGADWNKQAALKAKQYLDMMPFSRDGLIKQLEFEGFLHQEAVYGVDQSGADWNKQAVLKAKQYLAIMAFSRDGLIKQLEFEGFSHQEALFGVQAVGY